MTHNRHNATCERLGEMSLSQLPSLLCCGSCSGFTQAAQLARGAGRGGLGSSWLQEMPNKLIYGLTIHTGMGKWGSDPGPAGAVAAVVTFGMDKGWESCGEILVYMFGLHQKCFPLLLVAKFPVVVGLLSPVVLSALCCFHIVPAVGKVNITSIFLSFFCHGAYLAHLHGSTFISDLLSSLEVLEFWVALE